MVGLRYEVKYIVPQKNTPVRQSVALAALSAAGSLCLAVVCGAALWTWRHCAAPAPVVQCRAVHPMRRRHMHFWKSWICGNIA